MNNFSLSQATQVNALSKLMQLVSDFSKYEIKEAFNEIVPIISSLMNAHVAIFSRYDAEQHTATCLASSDSDFACKGQSYSLENTPCHKVIELNDIYICDDNADSLYPEDTILKDNSIREYIGAPVHDLDGNPIGMTTCVYKEGIVNQQEVKNKLRFLSQLLSEMLHKDRLQKALSLAEEKLSKKTVSSMLCLAEINHDGKILTRNPLWDQHPYLTEARDNEKYLSPKLITKSGSPLYRNKALNQELFDTEKTYKNNLFVQEKLLDKTFLINAIGHKDSLGSTKVNSLIEIQDITNQTEQAQKLHLIQNIIDSTNEAIPITNPQGKITNVNPSFERITGYEAAEVIGKNPSILQSGKHEKKFYKNMWNHIETLGYWEGDIWNKRKDGQVFPEHIVIRKITDEQGKTINYIAVFEDETLKHRMNEKITRLSEKDEATGLPNKGKTLEKIDRIIDSGDRFFLLFLYLDIKENYADKQNIKNKDLLNKISDIVKSSYKSDLFIGVISPTEFVIVLPEFDPNIVPLLIKRISKTTLENYLHLRKSGTGAIMSNNQITNAIEYISLGREAAKHAGTQTLKRVKILDGVSINKLKQQDKIENELLEAILTKDIYPAYEPLVDLSNNKIIGSEALARWQHPLMGMISPLTFLPIANRSGIFNQLTKSLLEISCKNMKKWLNEGHKLDRLCVNVAAQQLDLAYLPELMDNTLSSTGLDPKYLQIEVTEDSLIDRSQSSQVLKEIRDMGIRIAIDDFGTGYSSLSYLKELPAHSLKIDQSFVRNANHHVKDIAIITSIISLAKNLGMEVIAEGIENQQQRDMLINLGCDIGQGYYYSKAKKENQFKSLLTTYNQDI